MPEGLPLRMAIGLAAGLGLGILAHAFFGGEPWLAWLVANAVEPLGQIFLRLLFMLVIPLIVSALALAVCELGDLRRLGRIGVRTLLYTAAVSTVAASVADSTVAVAVSASMPSAVVTVARSASLAATRSLVVMRVSGLLGRKRIAMRLTTASGTAMRNECAMACA